MDRHLLPNNLPDPSPLSHVYRHDRFLAVRFTNRRHWCSANGAHAVELLAKQGLHFACRRYKYINHKVNQSFDFTHNRTVRTPWGFQSLTTI